MKLLAVPTFTCPECGMQLHVSTTSASDPEFRLFHYGQPVFTCSHGRKTFAVEKISLPTVEARVTDAHI